jgi:hypothetical protein
VKCFVYLPLDPKVGGFEPGQGNGFLRAIKIRSTPSFGWDVKTEVPCCKILRYVKDLLKSHGVGWTKFSFPSPSLLFAPEISLLTGSPDSTGGCQSTLANELGVSATRYHYTIIYFAITWGRKIRHRDRSSESSVSPHHNPSTSLPSRNLLAV